MRGSTLNDWQGVCNAKVRGMVSRVFSHLQTERSIRTVLFSGVDYRHKNAEAEEQTTRPSPDDSNLKRSVRPLDCDSLTWPELNRHRPCQSRSQSAFGQGKPRKWIKSLSVGEVYPRFPEELPAEQHTFSKDGIPCK